MTGRDRDLPMGWFGSLGRWFVDKKTLDPLASGSKSSQRTSSVLFDGKVEAINKPRHRLMILFNLTNQKRERKQLSGKNIG